MFVVLFRRTNIREIILYPFEDFCIIEIRNEENQSIKASIRLSRRVLVRDVL